MPREDEDDTDDRPPPRARRRDAEDDDRGDRPRRRRRRDDDDEYDARRSGSDATGGLIPYKNGKALAAYYCGVFGLISCVLFLGIFGVVPIVLGVLGLKHAKRYPETRGQAHAVTGIVLGAFEVLTFIAMIVFVVYSASQR